MIPLTEIFCSIDDFCKLFEQNLFYLPSSKQKRKRPCRLSLPEIMTILIMFQYSHYRTFKDFYLLCLISQYKKEFPNLVSYNRFIELIPFTLMPMICMMMAFKGKETGIYFIDSTKLPVCHNLRISRHKVFKEFAKRGKTSTGWFFGFKLHILFNHQGEIMRCVLSEGNVDDRAPVLNMLQQLKGWLIGDRGYISEKLRVALKEQGTDLITKVKKNMKEILIEPTQKWLLSRRNFVETSIDQLKNWLHLDHTRHRSVINFQVNVFACIIAFALKPAKPGANFLSLQNRTNFLTSN